MFRILLSLAILFAGLCTQAEVRVAFIDIRLQNGELVELEAGSRFAHVAIEIQNRWLHVSEMHGVELIDSLTRFGNEIEILKNPDLPSLTLQDIQPYLGKPYDFRFVWDDPTSSYCSKLIANILNIQPVPMEFTGSFWRLTRTPRQLANLPHGLPGISPFKLYQYLIGRRSFQSEQSKLNQCQGVL
ncbi:MAG: hypothetical protein COT74_03010 [Bdellovibrionales bacterium CG10_big_fil_rev_8_21_14_0_10_45_34]|nr:MAG: hypothetical protein COT74_03010 [Bdellovibrionales bacterium CG10_big_fil_rev_8_21_14_0_10_45_34]